MFVEQREPTGNLKVEYSGNERLEIQCDLKLNICNLIQMPFVVGGVCCKKCIYYKIYP